MILHEVMQTLKLTLCVGLHNSLVQKLSVQYSLDREY